MDYYGEPYGDFESHSLRQCYQLEPRQVDQAKVEAATNQWRQSPQYPGEGNFRFFNYALALRAAGMNLSEIENKLGPKLNIVEVPGNAETRSQASLPV